MQSQDVQHLIARYVADAKVAVARLRGEFGEDRLRLGPSSGKFPRKGPLVGGGEYAFHGYGCRVSVPGGDIELEFGPGGRLYGFDAWRLRWYVEDFGDPIGEGDLLAELRLGLSLMVPAGDLIAIGSISDPLFYRSDEPAEFL